MQEGSLVSARCLYERTVLKPDAEPATENSTGIPLVISAPTISCTPTKATLSRDALACEILAVSEPRRSDWFGR